MKKEKKVRPADIILIVLLLLAALTFFGRQFFFRHTGAVVKVRVDGSVVSTFDLSQDQVYEITGADGGHNTLIIKDGQAWIEDADCPDALCVHMGKISYVGQSIVCLPHKVVVLIEDAAASDSLDAVAR